MAIEINYNELNIAENGAMVPWSPENCTGYAQGYLIPNEIEELMSPDHLISPSSMNDNFVQINSSQYTSNNETVYYRFLSNQTECGNAEPFPKFYSFDST